MSGIEMVAGKDLNVGDVIEVWPGVRDAITNIEPYRGAGQDDPEWSGVTFLSFVGRSIKLTVFPTTIYHRAR